MESLPLDARRSGVAELGEVYRASTVGQRNDDQGMITAKGAVSEKVH